MGVVAEYKGGEVIWSTSASSANQFCADLCRAAGYTVTETRGVVRPDLVSYNKHDPLVFFCGQSTVPPTACQALAERLSALRSAVNPIWTDEPLSPWKGTLDLFVTALHNAARQGIGIRWR